MKLTLLVNPDIPRGQVLVDDDGVIVAYRPLKGLRRVEGVDADETDVCVNPVDVEEAKMIVFGHQGRLN